MKVLNLYSGIGGNRKLWTDCEVTAVEIEPKIAGIYQDFFPNDKVIVADAHEYLLKHFKEFDFIWSSPPCPSHSRLREVWKNRLEPIYPDMKLYQEIIFLKQFYNGNYVVENVIPYYKVIMNPSIELDRHLFWSNFRIYPISNFTKNISNLANATNPEMQNEYGVDLSGYKGIDKRKVLRNCVNPKLGLHIYNSLLNHKNTYQLEI